MWVDDKRRAVGAHRLAYELAYGPVPRGKMVCHRCDTPLCVNPAHLYAGTAHDNMRDKKERGRAHDQRGERNPAAKLTAKRVARIMQLAAKGELTHEQIGKRFGVARRTVGMIVSGKLWRHVANRSAQAA